MRRTICDANYDRLINLGVIAKSGALSGQCRRSELVGLIDSMVERLPHLNGVSEYCGVTGTLLFGRTVIDAKPRKW